MQIQFFKKCYWNRHAIDWKQTEAIFLRAKRLINTNNRQAMTSWNTISTAMEEEQPCDDLAQEDGELKRRKEEIGWKKLKKQGCKIFNILTAFIHLECLIQPVYSSSEKSGVRWASTIQ